MASADEPVIRIAHSQEIDRVAQVWRESALSMDGRMFEISSFREMRDRIERELQDEWVLYVAVCGEQIVGMLAIKPRIGVLDQIFVSPSSQAKGIGKKLLETAKAQMPDGFTLNMSARNERARGFYEKEGLQLVGQSAHPRHGYPVDIYAWNDSD